MLVLPYNAPSDILQAAQVDSFRHARSGSLSSGSDTGSSDGGHNRPKMKSAVMQVRCTRLTLCVCVYYILCISALICNSSRNVGTLLSLPLNRRLNTPTLPRFVHVCLTMYLLRLLRSKC